MKKSKYYTRFRYRGIDFKNEVEGYKIDSNCFVYKDKDKLWILTDIKSGLNVYADDTQTGCIIFYNNYFKDELLNFIIEYPKSYKQMCEEFENLPVHTYDEIDAMDIKEVPKDYEDL